MTMVLHQIQGRDTEQSLQAASEALFPAEQKTQEAEAAFDRAVKEFGDAVISQDGAGVNRAAESGRIAVANLNAVGDIAGLPADGAMQTKKLAGSVENFVGNARNAYGSVAASAANMTPELQTRFRDLAAETTMLKDTLQHRKELFSSELQEQLSATRTASEHQRELDIVLFLSTLAIAFVIVTLTIRRSITGPILHLVHGMQEAADQAARASSQVAQSSQTVARDAHEQAAYLQETSASLREVSALIRETSEKAHETDSLMTHAKETVHQAMGFMDNVNTSMTEIADSSREVAGVLKSLDEIAFNTNILALNAAVEAARAGAAGASFSVVADEVRSLARRAAEAARHSADIIDKTIGDIFHGVDLVGTAHAAFREVADRIEMGSQSVSQIAERSEKQAVGIQTIGQAVTRMEQVTQSNAMNAQQTAQSGAEMTSQVEQTRKYLRDLVGVVGMKRNN